MNKSYTILLVLLALGCTQDDLQETLSPSLALEQSLPNISSEEDVFHFLKQHHPEFDDRRIAEVRDQLHPTPTTHLKRSGTAVELPAGSMNGLQAAIEEAGEGGTVIIKAGAHTETGLVTATHEIHIEGEDGAVLTFENPIYPTFDVTLDVGLYLYQASHSTIRNLVAAGAAEGSGNFLVLEESHGVHVQNTTMENFQNAITVEASNNLRVGNSFIVLKSKGISPMYYQVMDFSCAPRTPANSYLAMEVVLLIYLAGSTASKLLGIPFG